VRIGVDAKGVKEYSKPIMKSPEPEEILELAQALKDAKAIAARLQAQWDSYFAPQGNVDLPFPKKGGRRSDSDSTTGKILAKLAEDPAKDYGKDDMGRALGIDAKKAERTMLKLYSIHKIARTGRGRYTAKKMEIAA
jgi:hypothetical protein